MSDAVPGPETTGPIGVPPNPWTRFARRWGFPLFVLLVLIIGRSVLLPFIFAALIAYLLAPVVRWLAERRDGSRRMPRGAAILLCYTVFLTVVAGFLFLLVPRIAEDVERVGSEAPALLKRVDDKVLPEVARWLEGRFPQLKPAPAPLPEAQPGQPGLPPRTFMTMETQTDGRIAFQLEASGIEIRPVGTGLRILPTEELPAPQTLEERIRNWTKEQMAHLRSQASSLVKAGQTVVTGVLKGVFGFFIVLMLAAFILIDMEKVHRFMRQLFPPSVRDDYDAIMKGIDRGLSGVIRGQLLICLVNGVLTYVGLVLLNVKYSLVLGVIAGVMSLIPIFGSIFSTIPIAIAALVSSDHGIDIARCLAAIGWIVAIHFVEANFLNPKIIGTAANIHPVLVVFSLILGERTFGLVGALLAVPVVSTVQVLFLFFYRKAWRDPKAFADDDSVVAAPPS